MKIGVAQLNSNDDLDYNFQQIKQLMLNAQAENPAIIFFPENSLYFRIDSNAPVQAITLEDKIILELKALCKKTHTSIHLTTAISENKRVFNATVLIDKEANAKIIYRKIHLFDIELSGQKPIRESDSFVHGEETSITDIQGLRVGNSICYDIRFAELFSAYAKAEVDIIAVPAAFLVKTGQAHWEVLLRARAIESQCYIVASAQSGIHRSNYSTHLQRETYGNSMLVNPWGEVTVLKPDGVGIVFSEINRDLIDSVRKQIPMKNHRRIDF